MDASYAIEQLKAVKSALILEARSLAARGFAGSARELYRSAARQELQLAERYRSLGREREAAISQFSAGSCLVQAGEYEQALPILEEVSGQFPEAAALITQCHNQPRSTEDKSVSQVQALVELLLKKRLITEDEWQTTLTPASSA